ncbi:hypothetical protein [Trinickia mobilis]|uniref:hypothetical protein n=1 Tax=Trinickia mobilis TaxID=2816356 RepID=UPI001A8E2CF7|nr:hypothetical protein [Trinickia mobilis]
MNRLHFHHWAALVPLFLGALILFVTLTSINQACLAPAADDLRPTSGAMAKNGETNSKPSHCLVYGKYCLGDTLRGR